MLATALQMAYPGVPTIYYGDEAGLEGEYGEDGRRSYPWGSRDDELRDFYRRAVWSRRNSPALSYGEVETVLVSSEGGYGFLRRSVDETVLALFNGGAEPLEVEVPVEGSVPPGESPDLLRRSFAADIRDGRVRAILPALGAAWYTVPGPVTAAPVDEPGILGKGG